MRRLGSSFVTLWIAFFLPSAIIWGLMLRWSIGAAGRVETIWRWMADRLAFPLLLDRPIEWSWRVIADGSPWQATGGFVFLTALWALMFALPLAIIGAWWVWLMSRGKHTSVSGTSSAHDPTMSMAALPSSSSTAPSPLGAIYILTLPVALVWATVRFLARPFSAPSHPVLSFLRPIVIASGLVFAIVVGWLALILSQAPPYEWNQMLGDQLARGMWLGYLDSLRVPSVFNDRWWDAWSTAEATTTDLTFRELADYRDQWYRQPELRDLILITAARHALGMAIVATVLQIVRRIL